MLGASRFDAYMAPYVRASERPQKNVSWDMIEVALSTCSAVAGLPIADVLRKGSEGRFNLPGDTTRSWWDWRALPGDLWADGLAARLRALNAYYARLG